MFRIRKKLQETTGASLSLALLFFVLCAVAGSVILSAATTVPGRFSGLVRKEQRSYAVDSAARLLGDYFKEAGKLRIIEKRTVNEYLRTTTSTTETTDNNGDTVEDTDVSKETYYKVSYEPIALKMISEGASEETASEEASSKETGEAIQSTSNFVTSRLFASTNKTDSAQKISNLPMKADYINTHGADDDLPELESYDSEDEKSWNLPVLSGGEGIQQMNTGNRDNAGFTIKVNKGPESLDDLSVNGNIQLDASGMITIDLWNSDEQDHKAYEKYRMNLEIPVTEEHAFSSEDNPLTDGQGSEEAEESEDEDEDTEVTVELVRSFTETKTTDLSWTQPTIRRGNVIGNTTP